MDRNVIDIDSKRKPTDLDQRKWMASSAVLVMLAAVALVNYQVLSQSNESSLSGSRHVASKNAVVIQDSDWEQWLSLREMAKRDVASIGTRPTTLDQLTVGVLEGKYLVRMSAGKLKKLEFSDARDDRPKYIRNRSAFIEKFKALLHDSYYSNKMDQDTVTSDGLVEVYSLLDDQAKTVGSLRFEMDNYGRLISLTVQ